MKTVWSNSLSATIVSGFSTKNRKGTIRHWTWDDYDMVYYRDDVDDCWYSEIPDGAILDK